MRGGLVLATIPDPKNTLNKSPGDDTVAARDLSAERERAVPFGVRRVSKGRKQGAQYRRPPRQLRGGRLAHRHRSGAPAGSAAEAACRGQRTNGRGECVVRCGRAERHHANQQDPFAHHGYFVKMQAMRAGRPKGPLRCAEREGSEQHTSQQDTSQGLGWPHKKPGGEATFERPDVRRLKDGKAVVPAAARAPRTTLPACTWPV